MRCGVSLPLVLFGLAVTLAVTLPAPAENRGPLLVDQRSGARAGPDRTRSIRVDVELVMVPVTVTDPLGRTVNGLEKEDFRVFEDKAPQPIVTFSNVDAPASIGLVFDTSGSMRNTAVQARTATKALLESLNPEDEVFLLTFANQPSLRRDFSSTFSDLQNALVLEESKGSTALIDAVYVALDRMRFARNPRRALLVVSDGLDNSSRYSKQNLMDVALEADVQIYTIETQYLFGSLVGRAGKRKAQRATDLLGDLANFTGGIHVGVRRFDRFDDAMRQVTAAIHNQYLIGYRPPDRSREGKWRKIKIKVNVLKGHPKLNVRTRNGYFGAGL